MDLPFGRLRQYTNTDGKDVGSIKKRLDRSMIVRTQVAQGDFHPVKIKLCALVVEYLHGPCAENFERKLVPYSVYIANRAPDDCTFSMRSGG